MFNRGSCETIKPKDFELQRLEGEWYIQSTLNDFSMTSKNDCYHCVSKFENEALNEQCEMRLDGHYFGVKKIIQTKEEDQLAFDMFGN